MFEGKRVDGLKMIAHWRLLGQSQHSIDMTLPRQYKTFMSP